MESPELRRGRLCSFGQQLTADELNPAPRILPVPLQGGWMSHLGGNTACGLISVSLQGAAAISSQRPRRSWQDFCPAGKYSWKNSPSRCQPPWIAGASLLCPTCTAEAAQGSLQPGSFCSQEAQIQPFFPQSAHATALILLLLQHGHFLPQP